MFPRVLPFPASSPIYAVNGYVQRSPQEFSHSKRLRQRQDLVLETALLLVEQGLTRKGRYFDQILRGTKQQSSILESGLARPGTGQDQDRERLLHFAAGQRKVAQESVDLPRFGRG